LTWSTYPDFQGVFRIYFLLLSSIIFAVLYKEDKSTIFKFLYGFMLSGCYLGVKTLSEFNVVGLVVRVTIEEMNNNSLANSIAVTSLFMIFIISNKQLKIINNRKRKASNKKKISKNQNKRQQTAQV
jgi:hypothetical protein